MSKTERKEIAVEIVERFTKTHGMDYDLAVVVISKEDAGYHLASTVPVDQAMTTLANVAAGTILSGGMSRLQQIIAAKIGGG